MEKFLNITGLTDLTDLYSPIWHNWVGLLCIIVIAFSCAFNIYSNWVDDTAADRIFYWCMLMTSIGAALTYFGTAGNPKVIFQTYLVLITIRMITNIMEHIIWHALSGKTVRKEK